MSKVPARALVTPVDTRLKQLLREKAERLQVTIHQAEVIPDHVHLSVGSDTRKFAAEMVTD